MKRKDFGMHWSRAKVGATITGLLTAGLLTVPAASSADMQSAPIFHAPLQRLASASSNWSGYFRTGATGAFHAATARWKVPSVKPTSGPTYSADWVGIDGATNSHLIQTGTESDYVGGAAHYDAWWEILPAAETPVFKVKPGDVMTASVKKGSGGWKITITDKTSGKKFSTTKSYSGPGTSVEWIEERPEVGGSLATLAKFGKATFDLGTANGANPHLKASQKILMVNNADTAVIATPSNPDSDTDGFSVAYGAKAPAPPAS